MEPPLRSLRFLNEDVLEWGVEHEHMNRLIQIADDIIQKCRPNQEFIFARYEFSEFFERHGVDPDKFDAFFNMCIEVVTATPVTLSESGSSGDFNIIL